MQEADITAGNKVTFIFCLRSLLNSAARSLRTSQGFQSDAAHLGQKGMHWIQVNSCSSGVPVRGDLKSCKVSTYGGLYVLDLLKRDDSVVHLNLI